MVTLQLCSPLTYIHGITKLDEFSGGHDITRLDPITSSWYRQLPYRNYWISELWWLLDLNRLTAPALRGIADYRLALSV
jgi:hypothetical protein